MIAIDATPNATRGSKLLLLWLYAHSCTRKLRRRQDERLLTQSDVADLLSVSRWTVARLIRRGDLHGVRVGDRLRFRQTELEAYLNREPT